MLHVLNKEGICTYYPEGSVLLTAAKSPVEVDGGVQLVVIHYNEGTDKFDLLGQYQSIRGTSTCLCPEVECEHSQALRDHATHPAVDHAKNEQLLRERLHAKKEETEEDC